MEKMETSCVWEISSISTFDCLDLSRKSRVPVGPTRLCPQLGMNPPTLSNVRGLVRKGGGIPSGTVGEVLVS